MAQVRRTIIVISTIALLLSAGFLLLARWLPWQVALRLTASAPFLFILPGILLVRAFLPLPSRIERAVAAVLLATIANAFAIFVTEELTERLTGGYLVLAVAVVNVAALLAWVVLRTHALAMCTALLRRITSRARVRPPMGRR